MENQKVIIYFDHEDAEKRLKLEKAVKKVLATYPNSLLAEVTDKEAAALKKKGYTIEPQLKAHLIRLKSVEIDTTAPALQMPQALSVKATERARRTSDYWIVQFVGPTKTEWNDQVKQLGGEIKHYIPENAFLVKFPSDAVDKVKALEYVNYVTPYEPTYKVSPLLMGRRGPATGEEIAALSINAAAFQPNPNGNLLIQLHTAKGLSKVKNEIASKGGTIVKADGNTIIASLDPANIQQIAKMVEVNWIEPFQLPETSNNVSAGIIGVQPVWDNHGLDGDGQIVSVADTGLDKGVNDATMHDDFKGRIVAIHDRAGDGASDAYTGSDYNASGHGTHVTGSVLGNGSRSNGTIRGMAHAAQLVFQATMSNSTGSLSGLPADLNTLFKEAYDDGARIHTNSWGNHLYGQYDSNSQDIDEFMWNHKDSIILFSVGNDGIDLNSDGVVDSDSLSSQSCSKNCISVGSSEGNRPTGSTPPPGDDSNWSTRMYWDYTTSPPSLKHKFPSAPINNDHVSNNSQGMAAFSSRGPCDDGRVKPDVVAPGTNILSVRSSAFVANTKQPTPLWGDLAATDTLHGLYCWSGGTSMSTPLTAGTVALIRQYLQRACLQANPSGALLKAILIHGATAITGQYNPSEVGPVPDNSQGWGLVNIQNSLFPDYPVYWQFRDGAAQTVSTSVNRDYTFLVVNLTVPFRATLVWTDYPSNPSSITGLVNQLQLSVIAPNGTTQGAPTNNNVQQVVIANPQAGTYTVRVRGVNVPTLTIPGVLQGQDFALVVSGGLDFVELYLKDNPADTGVAPSTGLECQSPDIWISLTNDPTAPAVSNPEYGQTNYVFVRVHNRGPHKADNATVKLYWANPGTNLSRPYWNATGIAVDGNLDNARSVNVPAHSGLGDGEAITQAFEWTPPEPAANTYESGHFCLFATVDHPDDHLQQEDVNAVRWEDNLAWKNLIVQDNVASAVTTMDFYVAGIQGASSMANLHIDRTGLPSDGKVSLKIPSRYLQNATITNLNKTWESEGGRTCKMEVTSTDVADLKNVHLQPGENTLVRLEVTLPENFNPGDIYPIFVEQYTNGAITGRVNLVVRMVGTPAYLANRSTGEIHFPNCEWAKKISHRNVVPYDDLNLALSRGYNGCYYCLTEYNTG